MKAGKLNRLLNEGFTLKEIFYMYQEIKKLALEEKKIINND